MLDDRLFNQIKKGNIFNVYIFEGESEIVKQQCIEFSKELLSLSTDYENIIEKISPEKNTISIEKVRKLNVSVFEKPVKYKYRIFVIEDAHFLRVEAQNALLKTLEDMPEYSIVIMTTHNKYSLLNTILSRSQVYRFNSNLYIDFESDILEKVLLLLQKVLERNYYVINKEKDLIKDISEFKIESLKILSLFFSNKTFSINNRKFNELRKSFENISIGFREKIVLKIEEIKDYNKVNINFQLALEDLIFMLIEELNKGLDE